MSATLLKELSSDNGKLFKEAIITREAKAGNDEFFAGLRYALDNIDTFGVKKVPVRTDECGKGCGLLFATFKILADALISRKITGNVALAEIDNHMRLATNEEWNGWYRKILIKDLGAGFSETTVNKSVKSINKDYEIPVTPYMRCSLPEGSNMEEWDYSKGIYSQLKADGMFAYVNISKDGYIWITSRGGTLMPDSVLGIEASAVDTFLPGTSTHGEFTVYRNGTMLERQLGNGVLNSISKGGKLDSSDVVVFDCWDQIPLDAFVSKGKYNVPYKERYELLKRQVEMNGGGHTKQIHLIETKIVYTPEEALAHYRDMRSRNLEGTVCKSPDAVWKDGTSKDLVKQKEVVDVELEVIGFTLGKNKNAATFGSMTCRSSCGALEVNASGFSDELREDIHNNRANWIGKIVTIRSNGIMYSTKSGKPHALFLPRFVEERNDKTDADSFSTIRDQFTAAIM